MSRLQENFERNTEGAESGFDSLTPPENWREEIEKQEAERSKERSIVEIQAELGEIDGESLGIADIDRFMETGELGPDDNKESADRVQALYDEYAAAIQKRLDAGGDLMAVADFFKFPAFGSRYDGMRFGEVGFSDVRAFCDLIEYDGYASREEWQKAQENPDSPRSYAHNNLSRALGKVPFTVDDVQDLIEKLPSAQRFAESRPDDDPAESARDMVKYLMTAQALERSEQALASGDMKDMNVWQLDLFATNLDMEDLAEHGHVCQAMGDAFCQATASLSDQWSVLPSGTDYLFSPTVRGVVDDLQSQGKLSELSQEQVENLGDMAMAGFAWSDAAKKREAERVVWVAETFDYRPGQTRAKQLLYRSECQKALIKKGLINGEDADRLYVEAIKEMRDNGRVFSVVDGLEPSGENELANYWSKNLTAFNALLGSKFYGTAAAEFLTEDGMPNDYLKQSVLDKLSSDYSNNPVCAKFIMQNRELFRDAEPQIFNTIFDSNIPRHDTRLREAEELSDTQRAVLDAYFEVSGKDREKLTKYLMYHEEALYEDGTRSYEYRYEYIAPEIIKRMPEFFQTVGESKSNSLRDNADTVMDWLTYEYGDMDETDDSVEVVGDRMAAVLNDMVNDIKNGRYAKVVNERPLLATALADEAAGVYSGSWNEELSEPQKQVLAKYMALNDDSSSQGAMFRNFMTKRMPAEEGSEHDGLMRYETMSPEAIDKSADILMRLYDSNSSQLSRLAPELAGRLLDGDPALADEKIDRLEHIFLRKMIPDFAKLYCCASVLYESNLSKENDISPVLKGAEDPRSLLMTDLLKVSVRSGNRSLRSYLESVIAGAEIEEEYQAGAELTGTEFAALEDFRDNKKFRVRFLGYARNLGFESAQDILDAMDAFQQLRDREHRAMVEEQTDGSYRLVRPIETGDLIKGINMEPIHSLIQNGFNCPEMIGDKATQDVTHWDTDFGAAGDDVSSLRRAISLSMASSYGSGVYAIVRKDSRFVETEPGDAKDYMDLRQYEAYRGAANGRDFHGIRTGLGSGDVDFYVISGRGPSSNLLNLQYELAKNGTYVPIVDEETEAVLFSPDDFEKLRKRFSGAERYGIVSRTGGERRNDLAKFQFAKDLSLPDRFVANPSNGVKDQGYRFSELVSHFDEKERETSETQDKVTTALLRAIATSDLPPQVKRIFENYRTELSEDSVTGTVDALSTGSTGRFTNKPGDADFDFVWRIDHAMHSKYADEIMRVLTTGTEEHPAVITGFGDKGGVSKDGIRKGFVNIEMGGKKMSVEVDISPTIKTDKLSFSSDQALEKRFAAIRAQDPEKYKEVIANIVVAKQLLKAGGAYKKGPLGEGGMGGIGVENWILQHGGSLRVAAQEFLAASQDGALEFEDFSERYAVFDLGENHLSGDRYPFDNFVAKNMTPSGYEAMVAVCKQVVGSFTEK